MKIGLALSGGGFRATVFHLGVLARLAEERRLEDVTFVSTVSGGSLCIGLVLAQSEFRWPTSDDYLLQVLARSRDVLTTKDLQFALLLRALRSPWHIHETRADDLSSLLRSRWGVTARLADLPLRPRWMINATCFETGKNWRFERLRMGDYVFGYADQPDFLLSDALAASAGFPILVGPLVMSTKPYAWYRYEDSESEAGALVEPARRRVPHSPSISTLHLWDGGVYDNHGLEGLHDFLTGWREDVDFLIVSDGAGKPTPPPYRRGLRALHHLVTGIMLDQIRSLRSRAILERLINHHDRGAFLQMGNTAAEVLQGAARAGLARPACRGYLPDDEVKRAAEFPTTIRRLRQAEFERLFRHGFELANCTCTAFHPEEFGDVPYEASTAAVAVSAQPV